MTCVMISDVEHCAANDNGDEHLLVWVIFDEFSYYKSVIDNHSKSSASGSKVGACEVDIQV